MQFSSSPLLMFRQFVFSLLVLVMPLGLVLYLLFSWLNLDLMLAVYSWAALAPLISLAYLLAGGRVRVEVTDDEVVVSRPLDGETRFARKDFLFTSRVVAHSVNGIPTATERILVALRGEDAQEIPLPNLAKKPFDALMAILLKDRVLAQAAAQAGTGADDAGGEPEGSAEFLVPKEEMQRDYRRMVAALFLGGIVLSAAALGVVAYMLVKAESGMPIIPPLLMFAGFFVLMFAAFGLILLMTYKTRGRSIPDRVEIADDSLTVGEEHFLLSEIRRVVATPPNYAMGNFSNARTVTVWTDRGKKSFNFGVRARGGIWKTAFEEYGELCEALEKTMIGKGIEFSYDL